MAVDVLPSMRRLTHAGDASERNGVSGSTEGGRVAHFPISDAEFLQFRNFFYQKTGMVFETNKRYFVDRRIAERAAVKASATFHDYFMTLRFDRTGAELQALTNLLTVNETYFLRENYQLAALVSHVLPEIAARKGPGSTIRIWSLPCSTGEEPYSIAMTVLDAWPDSDRHQIEILASDIDTHVLEMAAHGVYGQRSLHNVQPDVRARYFTAIDANAHQIIPELRESIDFFQLNLSNREEMARIRDIDVVFCRNLLIYFDDVSRREAVEAIFDSMVPGGFLYLGHSETMTRISSLFVSRRLGDCVVYQRPPASR